MNIEYSEYVIEIVECGSTNKAAQDLQMLQPNLSVCIRNLEQELGFPILCRQHSNIRLANEGELFLKSAREITTELETIHNIPSTFSRKDNLSISCTYSFDFVDHFLKFKRKKPPIACENSFKETGLIQTVRDVMEQRYKASLFYYFDMASDTYYVLAKRRDLKLIPIARNRPLILLTSKKNPLSHEEEVPFDNITGYKFVMYKNSKFDEWLEILNFKDGNNILYVFDRGGPINAVRRSWYITVVMGRFTDTYSENYVRIPIADSPFGMDAYCLHHASYTMNSHEKQFIRELKELFAENPVQRSI